MEEHGKKKRAGERQELVGSWKRGGLKARVEVPVTLEHVLIRAAQDRQFREALFDDPNSTIESAGLKLSRSEAEMLASLPGETLEAMVRRVDLGRQKNKSFLRTVAAAAMVGGMAVASCDSEDKDAAGGAAPDVDTDSDSDSDADTDADTDTDTDTGTGTDTGSNSSGSTGSDGSGK